RLAHAADVSAYLARHGETMRAMDSVITGAARDEGAKGGLEELSLKTISEDVSPVVKLVHSTQGRAIFTWRRRRHNWSSNIGWMVCSAWLAARPDWTWPSRYCPASR